VTTARRVLIADDHEPLRRGVLMALERGPFQVVAECGDGQSAVEETLRVRPEVCLLDVNMPGSGIEAAASIHRHLPSTRIVMLTISAESDDMFAAFRAGACGYLLKDTHPTGFRSRWRRPWSARRRSPVRSSCASSTSSAGASAAAEAHAPPGEWPRG
jgi:two-component system nitrate/nitrite response regulator NarL